VRVRGITITDITTIITTRSNRLHIIEWLMWRISKDASV
jgi:hypothetical protein